MNTSEKREQLSELARKRQSMQLLGYARIGDFHGGAYECDHVSPRTKCAANVNAEVMTIAQDWASAEYLSQPLRIDVAERGYDIRLDTNKNLEDLLANHFGLAFADTYSTNAFPFVKYGSMKASIRMADMVLAVTTFLIPQIEIVAPRIAICLGISTFKGIARSCGQRPPHTLDDAIKSPIRLGRTTICAVAHSGRLGTNNRGRERVNQDWAALKQFLD
jgi:restriction system protein